MVEGKTDLQDNLDWNHFASLMAHIANLLRFNRSTPIVHPEDFHPYYVPIDDGEPLKLPFSILRDLFVKTESNEVTLEKRE